MSADKIVKMMEDIQDEEINCQCQSHHEYEVSFDVYRQCEVEECSAGAHDCSVLSVSLTREQFLDAIQYLKNQGHQLTLWEQGNAHHNALTIL